MARTSETHTGICFLIDQHFEDLAEELRWTPERLRRLCAAISLTEYEVASLFRIRHCDMKRYLLEGGFPPTLELHLLNLERFAFPLEGRRPIYPNDLLPKPSP